MFFPLTYWMDVLRLTFWQLRLLFLSYRCCFLAMAMIFFLEVLWECFWPVEELPFYAARGLEELFLHTADVTCNKTNTHNVL